MINVKGKWALVTGGARGVGRQIALQMAGLGCNLILQSRSVEHSERVANEVRAMGVEAISVECDLESPVSISKMLQKIDETGKNVELVFNNAGLMSKYHADYFQYEIEDYRQAFAVNCLGPIMIAYHFLPKMVKNGFGRMQLTTSGIAKEPELQAYACAKAALDKFVRDFSVKIEGTDVMMNLMDPGWLRTDLGGPNAPNAVESVVPGALVGVLLDDKKSGRWFSAQDYVGLSIEDAVAKGAEK